VRQSIFCSGFFVPFRTDVTIYFSTVRFKDLMSNAVYDRNGHVALTGGIYFDLPAWGYHIFEVSAPPIEIPEEKKIGVAPRHQNITA
jgi:hypothetical protein